MRNLKKFLALVLAMMMVFSLMVTVNAASGGVTAEAAAQALDNYKVLEGFDGDLQLGKNITRAQMAAIVYRIMTGDTRGAGNDDSVINYGADATKRFSDAQDASWALGYIGFCANHGILVGYGDGTVKPNEYIKGYQVLAMLLRALGYGQNGEYEGDKWTDEVLYDATQHSLYGGALHVDQDPSVVSLRGTVAQMTYNALTNTYMVKYNASTGQYDSTGVKLVTATSVGGTTDVWGAPSTTYYTTFNWPDEPVLGSKSDPDDPLDEWWTPVTQATVARVYGSTGTTSIVYWLNGNNGTISINAGDNTQANAIGGQGRWTRVYADRIVCVDTFLSSVDYINTAVTAGGIEYISAGYGIDVYYNNYLYSLTSPDKIATQGYTGSGAYLGGNTISYAEGDMVAAYGVAAPGVATGAFSADGQISSLRNAYGATQVSATVSAIVKDTNGNPTGIVANGRTYPYNCTFAYDGGSIGTATSPDYGRLTDDDIGETVTLYLDAKGNILGYERATQSASSGVGVITASNYFRIAAGKYAAEVTVLTKDNTYATVRYLDGTNNPFGSADDAEVHGESMIGELVEWGPDPADSTNTYKGYSLVTSTAIMTITGSPDPKNGGALSTWRLDTGDADAIQKSAGYLVNDNTVFFLANWSLQQSKGGYVFSNWSAVTGFQNIMDLSSAATTKFAMEGNPYLGTKEKPAYAMAANGDGVTAAFAGGLQVAVISSGDWAKYVLVINAADKTTNQVETVDNYAYLPDPTGFVKVYDTYDQYKAVINGSANQTLNVNYQSVGRLTNTGMYTYGEMTNGSWAAVTISGNWYYGNGYNYTAGVLYDAGAPASSSRLYTVSSGAAIYAVNPVTGTSTRISGVPLNVIQGTYSDVANRIWFQLDQYGYINLIYVEIVEVNGTDPNLIKTISVNGPAAFTPFSTTIGQYLGGFSVSGGANYTLGSVRIEKLNPSEGTTWVGCNGNEVFNTNYRYRAVITVNAKNGYTFSVSDSSLSGWVSGATISSKTDKTVVITRTVHVPSP